MFYQYMIYNFQLQLNIISKYFNISMEVIKLLAILMVSKVINSKISTFIKIFQIHYLIPSFIIFYFQFTSFNIAIRITFYLIIIFKYSIFK